MSIENKVRVVDIMIPYGMGIGRPRTVKVVVKVAEQLNDEFMKFAKEHAIKSQESNRYIHGAYHGTLIEHEDYPATRSSTFLRKEIVLNDHISNSLDQR